MSIRPNIIDAIDYVNSIDDLLQTESHEETQLKLAIFGDENAMKDYERCLQVINECMSY